MLASISRQGLLGAPSGLLLAILGSITLTGCGASSNSQPAPRVITAPAKTLSAVQQQEKNRLKEECATYIRNQKNLIWYDGGGANYGCVLEKMVNNCRERFGNDAYIIAPGGRGKTIACINRKSGESK